MPKKKFIIFTHWRSGSKLFVDLLNSHPHIHCDAELFVDFVRLPTPKVLLPHWYINGKSSRTKTRVYGFKLMSDQLVQILISWWCGEADKYLNYLHKGGWKIIHLKRGNIFRKAVSSLVAQSTNRWHVKDRDRAGEKVAIDPDRLLARMKWYEETMIKEEQYLKGIPHLTIVYEKELLETSKHQKTMDAVFSYIGVPSARTKTQYRRTIAGRLPEILENYQEIYDVVRQTPYAKFLPSEGEANVPDNRVG